MRQLKLIVRLHVMTLLFAAMAIYSLARGDALIAPTFVLLAMGSALPFTRSQFRATGKRAMHLTFVRVGLQGLGVAYLVGVIAGYAVGRPGNVRYWLVAAGAAAVYAAIFIGVMKLATFYALRKKPVAP